MNALVKIATLFLLWALCLAATPLPNEIELSKLDGTMVKLSLNSRFTAFAFLSARCPCSKSHEEKLSKLCARFSNRGIRCIGIHSNANEPLSEAAKYFGTANLSFPVLHDP
ncbi:MAG TPA: redoxin domain-containing protein, partial [Oligoflexia bacterium]|nr:redoxin domain-containing protein [Oligoflexia bacterium]